MRKPALYNLLAIWMVALVTQVWIIGLEIKAYEPHMSNPLVAIKTDTVNMEAAQVKSEKQEIQVYILEVFGETDGVNALQIARCESGFDPKEHGDKHLMSINTDTGEEIGDSIGIFQIRTGSTNWNRAKKKGMTVQEFREEMWEYKNNIDYAKTIFDSAGGWHDWYNCMNKEL